jgi:hypothetical protein
MSFFAIARGEPPNETFADEQSSLRPRSGLTHALDLVEATVVIFRLVSHTSSTVRCAAEFSAFYNAVFGLVKSNDGTILYFHADEVHAIFNCPKSTQFHAAKALKCILASQKVLQDMRLMCVASVATDKLVVGYLGSVTRKTYQCFGPFDALRRMNTFALAAKIRVTATRRVVDTVAAYPPVVGKVFKFHAQEVAGDDGVYFEVTSAVKRNRPTKVPAHLRALPFFGVSPLSERSCSSAVEYLRTFCLQWLNNDPKINEFSSTEEVISTHHSASLAAPVADDEEIITGGLGAMNQLSATRIVDRLLSPTRAVFSEVEL